MPYQPSENIDRSRWKAQWNLRPGVTYLNHGSFGPSPRCVIEEFRRWQDRLESQPMDFFLRELPVALAEARAAAAEFVAADADDLVFVENATTAMNIVAKSVSLQPGDEVLLSNHEYGAVLRIWQRACRESGAKLVVQDVPPPVSCSDEIVQAMLNGVTPRTKLLVFSHVTSPTALVFPAQDICRAARRLGVTTCVDGPHAVAMLPLNLRELDCDFYTASCHKWLSAPFGSGFLYARRDVQQHVRPAVLSWGRPLSGDQAAESWRDEFEWAGTRDYSAFLSVPRAIAFLRDQIGLHAFREHGHALARYARTRLLELTGLPPLTPDDAALFGTMSAVPLPPGEAEPLQRRLFEAHGIEAPVIDWEGRRLLRVSCHVYNDPEEIDRLVDAVSESLATTRGA